MEMQIETVEIKDFRTSVSQFPIEKWAIKHSNRHSMYTVTEITFVCPI
jgi:hypothetical protein